MTDLALDANSAMAALGLSPEHHADVLALRGLLACGVLSHCLQMRHYVDYGVNRCDVCPTAASAPPLARASAHARAHPSRTHSLQDGYCAQAPGCAVPRCSRPVRAL